MKILLIGDYSMVHKNLKDGLEQLGHTVVLTSDGDYWKKLPGCDYPMTPKMNINNPFHSRILRAVYNRTYRFIEPYYVMWFYLKLCKKNKFDVIHAMSADLFDYRYRKRIYKFLLYLSHNSLSVSIPGDDWYIYQAWKKGIFRYMSFDNNHEQTIRFDGISRMSKIENEAYKYTVNHAKALIPLNPFETEIPYRGFSNLRKVIPLPLNTESIKYSDNIIEGKIRIYHGVSYGGNKGSNYILDALEIIKAKYGNFVEIITTTKISYKMFMKKLSECNIYIDQCKSYAYGMSAVIAMAMGKVVLSGLEPETLPSIQTPGCPIYNIIPDTEQIIHVLESIIAKKKDIEEIGYRGRLFVAEEHDYIKVAKKYIEEWTK